MCEVRVIKQNPFGSVIDRIGTIVHSICDVGNVGSRKRFACNVYFAILQRERVDERLPEPEELLSDIELIDDLRSTATDRAEACARRLVDVDDVGEV